MKNVKIKIVGIQGLEDQSEMVELMTEGTLALRQNEALLTYEEGEGIGQKGVKTTLHYKAPDTVILKRFGAISSKMVITKGMTELCRYNTGFGEMVLDITGERVEGHLDETGGTLSMSYRIDAGGQIVSRNQVEITVKEV